MSPLTELSVCFFIITGGDNNFHVLLANIVKSDGREYFNICGALSVVLVIIESKQTRLLTKGSVVVLAACLKMSRDRKSVV